MHVIEVNGLTKDYGSGRGVFNVSIHVDKGEVLGFLGPNGAGKSTTIRHLMGFSKPDAGEITDEAAYKAELAAATENLKGEITSSLLASLPDEVSEALKEVGSADLYALIVGSVRFTQKDLPL